VHRSKTQEAKKGLKKGNGNERYNSLRAYGRVVSKTEKDQDYLKVAKPLSEQVSERFVV